MSVRIDGILQRHSAIPDDNNAEFY